MSSKGSRVINRSFVARKSDGIVGKFVYKINILYRIYLCRNRNILSPCNPELVDLLDI